MRKVSDWQVKSRACDRCSNRNFATTTDITADLTRLIPKVGIVLHMGLHIAAGVERASGHALSGIERAVERPYVEKFVSTPRIKPRLRWKLTLRNSV